jgi:hypothetical protein
LNEAKSVTVQLIVLIFEKCRDWKNLQVCFVPLDTYEWFCRKKTRYKEKNKYE